MTANFTMDAAIEVLKQEIITDYENWQGKSPEARTEIHARMLQDFIAGLTDKVGSKYIKIISRNGSVWGFVVNTHEDKMFRYGDILKPASWTAPARNKARGNVFEDYSISWTGPHYL